MFTHLHVRSYFSFRAGGSSPEQLVEQAVRHGMRRLALTDVRGVYGVVRFQAACKRAGITSIIGAEVPVEGKLLVLLAENRDGYANLCRLLTEAHLRDRDHPSATLEELETYKDHLFCLTGTQEGHLWQLVDQHKYHRAVRWVHTLKHLFGDYLSIETSSWCYEEDVARMRRLAQLASDTGVGLVATGDVRYATRAHYAPYDLLTCIRHKITIFDDHPDRPRNDEAHLKAENELRAIIPYPVAFDRAEAIAQACQVDLLPGYITPPGARLPEEQTAREVLRSELRKLFTTRYPRANPYREQAIAQVQKELGIIEDLELEDFFLVVKEVVDEAQRRRIRCAGRGSAANSIITYILGITNVCPIQHNLLFERFLHQRRKGTPDIDIDFDSSRRLEIITWLEERFGKEQVGMTATVTSYLTKSAIQDVAKALGWPAELAIEMSKRTSHRSYTDAENRANLEDLVGPSPLLETLFKSVAAIRGYPRHLGQHSGGMVLSRVPLYRFTPLQVSANGVLVVQFDKDDLEGLGLVKLDVLGLRMMGCVSEATEIIERHTGTSIDLDALPLDDARTYNMICKGDVLGLFQIESPAQQSAGSQFQARCFDDLVKQIALIRPGPITGGMKNPFIRRHQNLETVRYHHPILKNILTDTYGVILFQEQVLEVVHQFAGLSLEEADAFRRLMSKFRDRGEMEGMRQRFVDGAVANGVAKETADTVFDMVSGFVGYGFCRSHAAAFAQTVYQSAWLKCHYPEAYYAAFFEHHPGMFARMTLEQDARRHRIAILPPCVNASHVRYDIEQLPRDRFGVRKALTSVNHVSKEVARAIVLERLKKPFAGVEDFYHRVPISYNALIELGKAGAFDALEGSDRSVLFKVKALHQRWGRSGSRPEKAFFDLRTIRDVDLPALPPITLSERIELDLGTHGAARVHPMMLERRRLNDLEVRPIETTRAFGTTVPLHSKKLPVITIAGLVLFRQMPKTAKGFLFLFMEDETGTIQCIVHPQVRARLREILAKAALIVQGDVQVSGNIRVLNIHDAWPLPGVIGGYAGRPGRTFGRDVWVRSQKEWKE